MRSKIMPVLCFVGSLITSALVTEKSGSGLKGVFCGVAAVFILAAVDCAFDYVEEREKEIDEIHKEKLTELAHYVQQGLEDGIKRGSASGLKVDYSFIDEEAAEQWQHKE